MKHCNVAPNASVRAARGFTLVEVLVSLIVISVGLLGIAKIQALAYASTGTAGVRSLAAIEAASLASAMHANRGYWSVASPANASITLQGTLFASADSAFQAALNLADPGCIATDNSSVACASPTTVAEYDLWHWARELKGVLPNSGAVITCPNGAPPVNCTIAVTWNEKLVAINSSGNNAPAGLSGTQTYSLYVEP